MLESEREKKEPYLFPPSEEERWLRARIEEREARRRRYFASRRKDGKAS